MSSLTQVSVNTRNLLVFGVILIVVYLILNAVVGAIIRSFRKPPPPFRLLPNNEYGQLPSPKFIAVQNSAGLNLILENVEGHPPESTTAAKVYKLPEKLYTNLSLDRARAFARNLGFKTEPVAQSNTIYLFTDPENPLRTLQMDIVNSNFQIKYDYTQQLEIFKSLYNTDKTKLTGSARNYINPLFDSSLLGNIKTDYVKVDSTNTQLIPATNRFDPIQGVKMNFFRPNLDGLKLVTPKFFTSPVNLTYIPSPDIKSQFLNISYTFWPISTDTYSLYGIRTSDQAWQDLKDGYGAVISMGDNTPQKIVIRDIYMAYYDSEERQSYLQPVYVFEGDNNFVAYVPAVSSELLQSQ